MRTTGVEGYAEALRGALKAKLVDTLECCEVCHSAEKYTFSVLGLCRVTLQDGSEAFVCCSSKKRPHRGMSPVLPPNDGT